MPFLQPGRIVQICDEDLGIHHLIANGPCFDIGVIIEVDPRNKRVYCTNSADSVSYQAWRRWSEIEPLPGWEDSLIYYPGCWVHPLNSCYEPGTVDAVQISTNPDANGCTEMSIQYLINGYWLGDCGVSYSNGGPASAAVHQPDTLLPECRSAGGYDGDIIMQITKSILRG